MTNIAPIDIPRSDPRNAIGPGTTPARYRVGDPAPPPLKPFTEPELIAMWGGKTEPLVSILCPTYNHREFLAATLDGLLGQRTPFPFEVIVRDDASTDGTTEIVRNYAARYPTVLHPIIESANTFSRGISFIPPLARRARGAYIALCGGDDYWIDAAKLESQVAALRTNNGTVLVSTACATVRGDTIVDLTHYDSCTPCSVRRFETTPASTWLIRADCVDLTSDVFDNILCEDLLIKSQADVAGDTLHFDNRAAAVYRKHPTSIWGGAGERNRNYRFLQIINSWLHIAAYHRRQGNATMARMQLKHAVAGWHDFLTSIESKQVLWFVVYSAALLVKRSILNTFRGRLKQPSC